MKDLLMGEETLFRNADVFEPGYVPECFSHRDSQLKELAYCMKPLLRARRGMNAYLFGNPATGKTSSVSLVLKQAQPRKFVAVHVNCHILQTPFRVVAEIHKKLFGFLPPETGAPLSGLYDKIFNKLAKERKPLLLILDEYSSAMERIVYDVLRMHESYADARTNVWCISARNLSYKMDDRTRSIFSPAEVQFHDYTREQMRDIIGRRSQEGLYPVVSKALLEKITVAAFAHNDLRLGINMLKAAALAAEASASRKITEEHLPQHHQERHESREESVILGSLGVPMLSGDLYKAVKKHMGYTKFYRTLKQLEEQGILKISPAKKGKGNTSMIEKVKR